MKKIDSLSIACQLLKELAGQGKGCSLADVSKMMDLPKSTAKRMLDTLESERFLERDGDTYKIGYALAKIRAVYRNEQNRILAQAHMNLTGTAIAGEDVNIAEMAVIN